MTDPVDARARSKLTPEVLARICRAIAAGAPKAHACAAEGLSRQALYQLAARDAEAAEAIEAAEAAGAAYYLDKIATADASPQSSDDWKRWAWIAERLHPGVFAPPPKRVEQSGPNGEPQEHKHTATVTIEIPREQAIDLARRRGKDGSG